MAPSAKRSRPATSSVSPHSSSRAACGSIPAHSGPRAATAACRRAPNGSVMRLLLRQFLELGDEPVGGGGVVQERGADLDGHRAGAQERAHVRDGADAAGGDQGHVGQRRVRVGQAAQGQRPDRGAAQPSGAPVGQRGRQRVADDDGVGAGLDHGARGLDHPEHVGAELGQHRDAARQVAADRGDHPAGLEGLADVEDVRSGRVGGGQVDLAGPRRRGRCPGVGPGRRTPPWCCRRSTRPPGRPGGPARAARWPGTARGPGCGSRSR